MMKNEFDLKDKQAKQLFYVISGISDAKTCRNFLLDLCTPAELKALADRWQVAQLIDQGMSYRDIADKTKVSTATITRVGRSLKYGNGGYQWALSTVKK